MGHVFRPIKCNMIKLARKRVKRVIATYIFRGNSLGKCKQIQVFGETITNDLRWNTHVGNICTKANRTLGFLRRNFSSCPIEVKEMAYKGLLRPILGYASPVWDPSGKNSSRWIGKCAESSRFKTVRFVTGNYNFETGSITKILVQLKWDLLNKGRKVVDSYCFAKV